ncbi:hypothetical protein Prudu_000216 [Prunus dulcis]|uniref:2-oxoglutarate and Fe(II)-dependent oxygenase superfamily protein n=1 Tax=Prunus dulcis TaxID=3755 RepID=A0A4Y1QKU9_PRUDU|nr:hypothetical protein Prudu_000216 [Prunus dulcis]
MSEVKTFDDTKEGVKGLVDAGITQVPRIFHQPVDQYPVNNTCDSEPTKTQLKIPVIDLEGLEYDKIQPNARRLLPKLERHQRLGAFSKLPIMAYLLMFWKR